MRGLVLALMLTCVACSPTTVVIVQPPPAGVIVTAQVLRDSRIAPIAPGQLLATGDGVALTVDLDHDAYVYVLYVDDRGAVDDMFPGSGDARIHSGSQRIPAPGVWWHLRPANGAERFVVLVARQPLDPPARAARAKPGQAKAAPASGRSPGKPPVTSPIAPREVKVARHATSHVGDDPSQRDPDQIGIAAAPDSDGVAAAVFAIDRR